MVGISSERGIPAGQRSECRLHIENVSRSYLKYRDDFLSRLTSAQRRAPGAALPVQAWSDYISLREFLPRRPAKEVQLSRRTRSAARYSGRKPPTGF